jgi:hypothetical protein
MKNGIIRSGTMEQEVWEAILALKGKHFHTERIYEKLPRYTPGQLVASIIGLYAEGALVRLAHGIYQQNEEEKVVVL